MAAMRLAIAAALFVALPAFSAQHIAVLELKNKLPAKVRADFPADYLTDQIREHALHAVDPNKLQIISRENLLVLLKASGKTLEECEGECEVDTGRRIGADFIVSGELVLVGSTVKASLKLHDTNAGTLLAAVTPGGTTAEELDKSIRDAIPHLLEPLKTAQAETPKPRQAPFVVEKASGPSTLADLPHLAQALKLLREGYYDPGRIDPQRMVDGAVTALASVSQGAIAVDATSVQAAGRTTPRPVAASVDQVLPALKEVGRFLNSALPLGNPLLQGAAGEYVEGQGMLTALDPRSTILPPSVYSEMKTQTRGNFGGVGLVANVAKGKLSVVRVLPDTPSSRADIHGGDVIAVIDGKPTEDVELADSVALMRGAPGSKVRLILDRGGKRIPVELERAVIQLELVRSAKLEGGVGYVRLESYANGVAEKVRDALASLGALKGLVFDLRANPGGLLKQAVEISDLFLPSGEIVSVRGAKLREDNAAKAGDPGEEVPLVVLVDGASGSATEITAGALRYNGRALLIGQKTAGRGTVQSLYELQDGAGLKITTAQYLVAGLHAVEGLGIAPDVERDTKFEADPSHDPSVTFARDVLLGAHAAGREGLLDAARKLARQ